MLTKFKNNRLFDAEPGAGGGGQIVLGGDAGEARNTPPVGGQSQADIDAAAQAAADAAAAAAVSGGTGGDDDISDFDTDADKFATQFLTEKYTNLENVKVNKNGDIVNVEGDVLVTKADLVKDVGELKGTFVEKADAYIKTLGTVQVGEEDLAIEEDGSVKGADGEVLLTAEQLREQIMASDDYLEEESEFTNIYDEAASISGLSVLDESGNVVEFTDDAEGLAQRDIMLVRQEGNRIGQEAINGFFNENADLLDAFYYKKANGSLDGFGQRTNHEGVALDKENLEQHYNLVVEAETLRGKNKADATKLADLLKANDMLFDEAGKALSFMQGKEKADKLADKAAFDAEQKRNADANAEYWTGVQQIVESGRVSDYNIPENIRLVDKNGIVSYKSRADFYEYLSQPVKGGLTQAQVDASSEPLDLKIFYDFLRFTGNNINYVVDQRVKQNKVKDAKTKFNSGSRIPNRKVKVTMPKAKSRNDNIAI